MQNYFFDMIRHLREDGEILVFKSTPQISMDDERSVIDYLSSEYERECLEYPSHPPNFDGESALRAAKMVFFAAQLLLNRGKVNEKFYELTEHKDDCKVDNILSSDLCLRFLPEIIAKANLIDGEDEIIAPLQQLLKTCHYSDIKQQKDVKELNFEEVFKSRCITQLYVDRIIRKKAHSYLENKTLKVFALAFLGDHKDVFWPELMIDEK